MGVGVDKRLLRHMKVFEMCNRFGLDALTLTERPRPQRGPDEVLVRLKAASWD
jgi:NADPH:quinone reductase-like Zn-dependent oxidoreductase